MLLKFYDKYFYNFLLEHNYLKYSCDIGIDVIGCCVNYAIKYEINKNMLTQTDSITDTGFILEVE